MKLESTYPTEPAVRGWIFYDAACSSCVHGQRLTERIFRSRGFNWLPLQTPGAAARLGVHELAFEIRMHLLLADGRVFNNADAFGILCRSVWWLWPVGALLLVPGFREIGRWIYDWFARNRYRFGGACEVDWARGNAVSRFPSSSAIEKPLLRHAIPLVVFVLLAFLFARHLEPWVWMWTLAFALFVGCKWLTHATALRRRVKPTLPRALGYLLMWPGMDAESFYKNEWLTATPKRSQWIVAGTNIAFGTALVWIATPRILPLNELSAGWIGMTGAVLVLPFVHNVILPMLDAIGAI